MKNFLQQFKKKQQGMTMIETIVALGILVTGITASLTLMISAINYSKAAERSIVVTNLAREGVEIVRTLRDYGKTITHNSFDVELLAGNYIVYVDTGGGLSKSGEDVTSKIAECDVCKIYLKDGKYTHDNAGTETIYRRLIQISDEVAGQEKKVTSEIYWTNRGASNTYKLETRLTNW